MVDELIAGGNARPSVSHVIGALVFADNLAQVVDSIHLGASRTRVINVGVSPIYG